MPQFVRDVEDLRERARQKIEEGPVTGAYRLDKERTIAILNEALATEIVCVLRYMHHYFMATGVHGKAVADEFKEHADAERDHADQIAERIQQLGGKPDYNPKSLLERSASQYVEGETLADMIREDLIAERVVIDVYSQMIRYFGDKDSTTRVLMEGMLKDEEQHAADLADLLYIVNPQTGESEGQDPGTHPLDLHDGQDRPAQTVGQRQQRPEQQRGNGQQRRQQQRRPGFEREAQTNPPHGQQTRGAASLQPQHPGRGARGNRESTEDAEQQQLSQQQLSQRRRPGREEAPEQQGSSRGQTASPGTTFAGTTTPNPPGVAGSRASREKERGRGGRKVA